MNPTSSSKGMTYDLANWAFKAPVRVQNWTNSQLKSAQGTGTAAKIQRTAIRVTGSVMKDLVDYDYREFPRLVIGKYSIPLAAPPKGALLLLLYPGTVIPRLYRAYQRGKQNNDYREVGDVLRRDLTAITLFVFALGPVVKGLSALTQKFSKVKLLDPKGEAVLKYSQFNNYKIDGPEALKAILAEGNGKALVKAVNGLHDRGLSSKFNDHTLANAIGEIKKSVEKLVDGFNQHNPPNSTAKKVWPAALDSQAKKTHEIFDAAEHLRKQALDHAKSGGSAEMAQIAKKMEGEFTGVLQNYAKVRRLPADLVSFAILVGAIGYLPMWVNTEWNKRQFEKKMAAKAAAHKQNNAAPAPSVPPTFGFSPMMQQAQSVFAPQMFGTVPNQLPHNPFNFNRIV